MNRLNEDHRHTKKLKIYTALQIELNEALEERDRLNQAWKMIAGQIDLLQQQKRWTLAQNQTPSRGNDLCKPFWIIILEKCYQIVNRTGQEKGDEAATEAQTQILAEELVQMRVTALQKQQEITINRKRIENILQQLRELQGGFLNR